VPPVPPGWQLWINEPSPKAGARNSSRVRGHAKRRRLNAWILGITGAIVILIIIAAQLAPQPKPSPSAAQDQATPTVPVSPSMTRVPVTHTPTATAVTPTAAAASPKRSARKHRHHSAAAPARTPVLPTCGAPANPYHLNLCGRGHLVYNPPSGVCGYFSCIENFPNGSGYMVECNDHMYSMSGGRRGACSYHGGEDMAVTQD
jgi:hypothetical protein